MKRGSNDSPGLAGQKPPRKVSRMVDLDINPHLPETPEKGEFKLCIHDLFKTQAQKTPDLIAVEASGGAQCTYKELDEWSDKLAAKLRVQYGARPQTIVGIFMERCLEYVIAYLGALKTGGAYCPVEMAYPPSLLESIFNELSFVVVLTKAQHEDKLPEKVCKVHLDEGWLFRLGDYETDVLLEDRATSESRCYVIFSGGTTGKPKAIEAPHRSPTHSYLWRLTLSGYGPGARVACNVFFVWEVLRPLLRGGCSIIVPDDVIFDSKAVVDFMQAKAVTEMLFTPSLLETILTAIDGDSTLSLSGVCESLKVVYMNGEVITVKLLHQARRLLPGVRLLSTYSISECGEVGGVDLAEHRPDICPKFCPAGHLASHCKVLLLDEAGEEATETGEVLIAGPGVGTGYIGMEKLTKERFVKLKGEIYYRTGDRARFLAGGLIEIIGRCDYMVKVRGYSIVLPAVETAILKRMAVSSVVVVTSGDEGTDKRIVAYVVPEKEDHGGRFAGWKIDKYGCCPELFRVMSQDLPHYAIPHTWVEIPELKMNMASGKADRKTLPTPPDPPPKAALPEGYRLPVDSHTNELEQALCSVFEEVLGATSGSISAESNFFELGGHSLSASRLLARVRACGGGDVAMGNFLRHPTARALAALVADPIKATQVDSAEQIKTRLEQEVALYTLKESGMNLGLGKQFWGGRGICHWRGMGPQMVLVTGTSGFLGAFLLRDLLLNTNHSVVCIIRAGGAEEARKRTIANLKTYGITSDNFESMLSTRVNFVAGDIEKDKLGLPAEQYDYLTMTVDSVVHAAAKVNLSLHYNQLVTANVHGTRNILEFATVNRVKSVSYVSSNAVYPDDGTILQVDEKTTPEAGVLESGYSQTKWVCERLVAEAHRRGLPCAVYRLGNLAGPTGAGPHKDGCWNPSDSNLILLEACMRIGAVPSRLSLRMEATPVDYVSQFIVAAIKNRDVAESHANGKTFNLIGSSPVPLSLLPSLLGSALEPLRMLPLDQWIEQHHKNPPKRGLPFTESSLTALCGSCHNYGQENVEAFAAAAELPGYPGMNAEQLRTFTLKLIEVGSLTRPPPPPPQVVAQEHEQRLRGRIAVVTGASSGMGEGLAEALAKEGAAVALFARRTDVIDAVQKKIEKMGGLALAVPVDVTDQKAVRDAFARVQRDLGEVDILINAAGLMYFTLMRNQHFQEWETMIDTNCKGVVNCAGSVIKSMVRRGTGHIVNISSDAARTTFPALSVYNASKAFVTAFSKGLRAECVGTGVRVTDIQPGDVATNLIKQNTDKEAGAKVGVELGEVVGKGADRASVLDVADICRAILFAVTSPAHVGIHEMLIEPRDQMFGDPTSLAVSTGAS